jgi:tetratricopeptide (TPR) repeat protein
MKKNIYLLFIFLCPVISLFSTEIGVDTDTSGFESLPIIPKLSPVDKSNIEGLSHFGVSLLIKKHSGSSDQLLAALAENPNSSRILAFLLKNFQNYKVSENQLKTFIAIAKANPRALPLNVAALALVDCVKPVSGNSIDLKRTLAEKCVAKNDLDKFNKLQFVLFENIVKTLSAIYLKQKKYEQGDELFEQLFENKKLYQHNVFLQLAVIFYTKAAQNADKSRRFLWLLSSRAAQYNRRKLELLDVLHSRSDKTDEMKEIIKHLAFLQKLGLLNEEKTLLFTHLAKQPAKLVLQIALAELFNKQKRYALAAMLWQKMAKRNPKNKFFRLKLAENAFRAGLYQLAAENHDRILQSSHKKNPSIIFMLVLSKLQLGEPEVVWVLLKMLPATARFVEIRAHVLSVLGKDKQAFEMLSKIILNSPKKVDKKLYFFWLVLAIKSESPEVQLNCLKIAQANLDAKDAEVANSIGYTYADLNKNLPEAEKLISYALSQKVDRPEYLDSMAWVLFRMKKFKQAAVYIEKAISQEGRYPNAVLADHAGDIFNVLGDKKKALYYWKLALKIFSFDLDKNKTIKKIKAIESR